MKKFLSLLLALIFIISLSACGKDDPADSYFSDYPANPTESSETTETSSELSSDVDTDSTPSTPLSSDSKPSNSSDKPANSISNKPTESKQSPTTQSQTSNSNEFSAHPGKDHVFDNETILVYPTALREGYYGKRCIQTKYGNTGGIQEVCAKVQITKKIPKRSGNYSSIDPAFKVKFSNDDPRYAPGYSEWYQMIEGPDFYIVDSRTCGAVPTILYNKSESIITITVELKNGTIHTHNFDVTQITEFLNQGYMVNGRITDDTVTLHIGGLTGSGG